MIRRAFLLLAGVEDSFGDGDSSRSQYQYYHYMEIGLCNWQTLIELQPPEQKGLSVEALPLYVEELRKKYAASRPRSKLINAAVLTEAERTQTLRRVKAFYIPPENISHFDLPYFFACMTRMGEPHPFAANYLEEQRLSHLMVSRWVPAVSLHTLLDTHGACRIGLLKLDVEGLDVPLIRDYVAYLQLHPACWADVLQFEIHPGLVARSSSNDLDHLLALVGYESVCDERAEAWPTRPFDKWVAHQPFKDGRRFQRGRLSHVIPAAPAAPKLLHLLMPCWNTLGCDDALERRRMQWAQLLPGWRVEAWSGERLSKLPKGPSVALKFRKYQGLAAKYLLLSHFGGAFVDWRLNPEPLKNLQPGQEFQCLDPGPLRYFNGMVMVARPFDPLLQEVHLSFGIFLAHQTGQSRQYGLAVNFSVASTELAFLDRLWLHREGRGKGLCARMNFSIL